MTDIELIERRIFLKRQLIEYTEEEIAELEKQRDELKRNAGKRAA